MGIETGTHMNARSILRAGALLALTTLLMPLGGCDFFLEDPTPDEARVELSGNGSEQVRLLLSKNFLTARSETGETTVELLEADTVIVAPPFERTFDIRDERQFFAQARAADTVATSVRVRVFLDGEMRFDQSRDVLQEPLQFLYLFNRPILSDVEVL